MSPKRGWSKEGNCQRGYVSFSAINSPSLTTMNVPKKLIGSIALKHLLNSIEDPTSNSIKSHIGATLVVRHSTDEYDFDIE